MEGDHGIVSGIFNIKLIKVTNVNAKNKFSIAYVIFA